MLDSVLERCDLAYCRPELSGDFVFAGTKKLRGNVRVQSCGQDILRQILTLDTQNGRVLERISVFTKIMDRIHWLNSQV